MSHNLPFGLKDGKLVNVGQVDRGLACGCVCPACNGPLIARQGDIRIHHFAHHGIPPCSEALVVSIRAAIKQLLDDRQPFALPVRRMESQLTRAPIAEATAFVPDEVEYEPQMPPPLKADFCLVKGGLRLAVVLQFKRATPVNQKDAFVAAKQPAITIDLVPLLRAYLNGETQITLETLEKIVIKEATKKSWIYHRKDDQIQNRPHAEKPQRNIPFRRSKLADRSGLHLSYEHIYDVIKSIDTAPYELDTVLLPEQILRTFALPDTHWPDRETWIASFPLCDRPYIRLVLKRLGI
jgi:hypothetical protein